MTASNEEQDEPTGPCIDYRRARTGPGAIPTVSRRARFARWRERMRVDPPLWVVVVAAFLAAANAIALATHLTPDPPPDVTVELEGQYIVIPTCTELDDLGYDGLASCIDADGKIVRVGE